MDYNETPCVVIILCYNDPFYTLLTTASTASNASTASISPGLCLLLTLLTLALLLSCLSPAAYKFNITRTTHSI
jgi:hypothetical protein